MSIWDVCLQCLSGMSIYNEWQTRRLGYMDKERSMMKWEYLVLVENVRSLKSLEDLAKDDQLYADQLREGNYAPSLNKYGEQGWELVSASRVGGGRALTEYVFKRLK